MSRTIHLRNVRTRRFTSGGGDLCFNIDIDREAHLMTVRECRKRARFEVPLGEVAKLLQQRQFMALAREKAALRKARKVRRGVFAGCGCDR